MTYIVNICHNLWPPPLYADLKKISGRFFMLLPVFTAGASPIAEAGPAAGTGLAAEALSLIHI